MVLGSKTGLKELSKLILIQAHPGHAKLCQSPGQYRLTFMCPGIPLTEQKFEKLEEVKVRWVALP